MRQRRAYAILLAVVVVWAGNFPLSKLGLAEIGPLTVGAARALVAVPLLLLVARARRCAYHLVGALLVAAGVYLVTR